MKMIDIIWVSYLMVGWTEWRFIFQALIRIAAGLDQCAHDCGINWFDTKQTHFNECNKRYTNSILHNNSIPNKHVYTMASHTNK